MKTNQKETNQLSELGKDASRVFSGKSNSNAIFQLYLESAKEISDIISIRSPLRIQPYNLADFGSFRGELLKELTTDLKQKGYNFKTTAIDRISEALKDNMADNKIMSGLTNVPLDDKSIDIAISRYTLAWNSPSDQKRILSEMSRICNKYAIVQHAGADNKNPELWRHNLNELLTGKEIPQLKRQGQYFTSRKELESLMNEKKIKYFVLDEKRVNQVSDVFIERYCLNDKDAYKTREILNDKDYIIKTTLLILPK